MKARPFSIGKKLGPQYCLPHFPSSFDDAMNMLTHSVDGLILADATGKVLLINPAVERVTHISPKMLLGNRLGDLLSRGIGTDSAIVRALEKEKPCTIRLTTVGTREVLSSACPVRGQNGSITGVVCNLRSIADLHRWGLESIQKIGKPSESGLIVRSKAMTDVIELARRVAGTESSILILGETGVGKDVLARFIYDTGKRPGPFIKVNCSAVPGSLFESEFFGYEAGAFTGARQTGKSGFIERADKGVLFLDEIGELPLELQSKLLTVLESHEVVRVGGKSPRKIDVRIVAATNKDLAHCVRSGHFREDLYYRIAVIPIYVPPLRERKEDTLELLARFVHDLNIKYGIKKYFDPQLVRFLCDYGWPGNVRELRNVIERLFLMADSSVVTVKTLEKVGNDLRKPEAPSCSMQDKDKTLRERIEQYEINIIRQAIEDAGTYREAAFRLGISLSTINRKARQMQHLKKLTQDIIPE
ncbi:MAG: sigma 54-interacting transcriptional regulator [Syntrophorhabdaceae bacterium]|nr:sigma 54-interacting transcriptional regulator [Syntrophorhabdaceae bacterium]MDD5244736.1 sigma 54-interacting transcriptional regulator [Syntrophorhabdaceae bacterium]